LIFNGECDAMFDMTLNETKVKVILFGTIRFLIYDLLFKSVRKLIGRRFNR